MTLYIGGTGSFAAELADWARAAGHRVEGLIELHDPIAAAEPGGRPSSPTAVRP